MPREAWGGIGFAAFSTGWLGLPGPQLSLDGLGRCALITRAPLLYLRMADELNCRRDRLNNHGGRIAADFCPIDGNSITPAYPYRRNGGSRV